MPLNAEWHGAHVLGSYASLDDRVAWHREHERVCGCRRMPDSISAEIARRDAAEGGDGQQAADTAAE